MTVDIRIRGNTEAEGLSLANGNFQTFWSALGFWDDDWCGQIDARIVLERLRTFDTDLSIRAEHIERGPHTPTIIHCGLRPEQVARYVSILRSMAQDAERLETPIIWS